MPPKDLFSVPRKDVPVPGGVVQLPIFYRDACLAQALYLCPFDDVAPKLYGTGLVPVRSWSNKALVGVASFEYRDTSIGPYNEVGVGIACYPARGRNSTNVDLPPFRVFDLLFPRPRQRAVGFYILDLPVTTDAACVAGREIWGYPKFVADIAMAFSDNEFQANVLEPNTKREIVSFSGPLDRGVAMPGMGFVLYSNTDDTIHQTSVTVDMTVRTSFRPTTKLTVGSGDHPMEVNLRQMGLADTRPFLLQTTTRFRSRLSAGAGIATWKTPCPAYSKPQPHRK